MKGILWILIAAACAATPSEIAACSYSWRSIDDEIAEVDYVFAGTVIEVDTVDTYIAAVIEVEEVWKGRVTSRFEVWTPASPWVCSFTELHRRFEVGWKLLLFAQDADMHVPGVNTWAANRSMPYEQATDDLLLLGDGDSPNAGHRVRSGSVGLSHLYPNPASDRISIDFELKQSGVVNIQVYDMLGRRVAHLESVRLGVGRHQRKLRLPDLARSRYLIVVQSGAALGALPVSLV